MVQIYSVLSFLSLATLITASIEVRQDDGYTGYNLHFEGERDSVVYETEDTPSNVSAVTSPDVYLNASVHVGEIDILVANLSAKVNLDAQVLNLLDFNAGVTASIDRVSLSIQNVTAKVTLEARLANLVLMISDVLDSIDLNPIIATLGNDVGQIINSTTGLVGDATSGLSSRSYSLEHEILYSLNDYMGNAHTNRVLSQTGDLVDEYLDNNGVIHSQKTIGNYLNSMTFTGHNRTTTYGNKAAFELEYKYNPVPGVESIVLVYTDAAGAVLGTAVLAESNAGGESTVGN